MGAEQFITIKKGDATTLTETVTGLVTASGYTAKMYIYDSDGTVILTITGTVNTLAITYQIENEDTKNLTIGTYAYETKLFDTFDHVYSQSNGIFEIRGTNEDDPS